MAASDFPRAGESYVPQIGGEIELERLHRYHWAAQFAGGKRVLDIACGEGSGGEILAGLAAHVIGVDLSEESVVHASRKHCRQNLEFMVGSCDRIPVSDASVDLVVSFETIERHNRHQEMMREIKRILCPKGMLIISSPDKDVYSGGPAIKDQFHIRELSLGEFEALLRDHFSNVHMFGQRTAYGSIIVTEAIAGFISFDSMQKSPPAVRGIERAIYNVAIATDSSLPEAFDSIFEQDVARSEACRALRQAHAATARELEACGAQLVQLKRAVKEQEEAASRREEKLRDELAKSTEKRIEELKASLSWRITGPLRFVRDRLDSTIWRARKAFSKKSVTATVTSQNPLTAIAPLFDERYYTLLYPKAPSSGRSPMEHYRESGWKEGLKPHPLFDPTWYLKENPDVAQSAVEPLYHYVTAGWREGRSPHPLFDVRYYLDQAPKLAEVGVEPLVHFLQRGAREGLKPNPFFDPTWYAGFNGHSMAPGENPLIHYATRGWKEGCDPDPSFNISLYREVNPEARNEDALLHYLHHRSSQGKPPSLMPDISAEPPHAVTEPPEVDVKAIALYLPQFHRIPENDLWWGEGFTEWTNVRRGKRQFWGHYQPHVPHPDIGYYDLTDPTVMEKQAQMARQFGICGFCFYYYWFNGRRLLEMPTDRFLASGKPDFPFCFCWANENWTRRWDGQEHEVLMGQQHSYESDERFIRDILPAFRDRRYIRINGRPLLAIYRPGSLPDPKGTFAHWREVCRNEGIGEIYLTGFKAFGFQDPEPTGMDAAAEFVVHHCGVAKSSRGELPVFNNFEGKIYDYRRLSENILNHATGNFTLFRQVMPSWDNTARRQEHGTIFFGSDPQLYCRWLQRAVLQARRHTNPDERLIFINSWNEWAEGAHIEPDERYGYAWLDATRLALEAGVSRGDGG